MTFPVKHPISVCGGCLPVEDILRVNIIQVFGGR